MSAPLPGHEADADRFALLASLLLMFVSRLSPAQPRKHQRCAAAAAKKVGRPWRVCPFCTAEQPQVHLLSCAASRSLGSYAPTVAWTSALS